MRGKLLITLVLTLLIPLFAVCVYAAIENCDFSGPRDGDIDGLDLAQFIAYYSTTNSAADVNGDAAVNPDDVAYFAGFFGGTYTVTARRPNILLIIADDVGIDVVTDLYPTTTTPPRMGLIDRLAAIYGNGVRGRPASVPMLTDRLAAQGMVFSNAWSQPYCSPARATVATGLFEDKTQVTGVIGAASAMQTTHITFVQKLHDAGYSTAMLGKWHLGGNTPGTTGALPKQVGFDYYRGYNGPVIPDYWSYPVHWQDSDTPANTFNTTAAASVLPRSLPAGTTPAIGSTTFAPVVKGADTIDWIDARTNENPDKPWFVWLAFNASHATSAQAGGMPVPNEDTLDTPTKDEINSCGGTFGSKNDGLCNGKHLMRALTNSMDTVIGKILDKIDSLGSDTYVIFIGDNGTPMYGGAVGDQIDNMYIYTPTNSNHGKGTAWEGGCHVPMVIRGPGIAAGGWSSEPVHVADLFATILTLAELTPPTTNYDNTGAVVDSDSRSLTPILFGSTSQLRDPNEGYLLTETSDATWGSMLVGARNAYYKLLCNTSKSSCFFYKLVDDPLEQYPITLSQPVNCTGWTTDDDEWHYCRLMDVINQYSILSP